MNMNDVLENQLLTRWATLLPRPRPSLGAIHEADCELVRLAGGTLLALTIDAVDEEIDAGLYDDPVTAGRMAAIASLSDLAAVGADPLGLLLSVTLPEGDRASVQARVAEGVAAACAASGTGVLGGDTSEGRALRVATVGVGTVPEREVLRRVGLRPGDRLFASGHLGAGAALAAVKLLGVEMPDVSFQPTCRVAHGRALRSIASGCIDTSDGLVAALDQLARLNQVALDIDEPLPTLLAPSAQRVRRRMGIEAFPLLASCHGEFELVFAVPPERLSALGTAARALDWQPIALGWVTSGAGLRLGGVDVDGAAIRNLYPESGGDVGRYVSSLVALGRRYGQP